MSSTVLARVQDAAERASSSPDGRGGRVAAAALAADELLHPGAIAAALAGVALFLVASWVGWGFGTTSLLIKIIFILMVVYFVPLIEFGATSAAFRGDISARSFRQFLAGRVEVFTGRLSGSAALVQIAFMPLALGCLMGFFAALWRVVSG